MPRRRRPGASGIIFHIVNRGAKRAALFEGATEFEDFELLLQQATARFNIALYAYCLMPNHWHLLLSPRRDGSLSRCMHWLTLTHARRWQIRRGAEGLGAVYQGRFHAIPVEGSSHFLCVCRYIERNALRANLVESAAQWRWSSLWQRREGDSGWLTPWPERPNGDWLAYVNAPHTDAELRALRTAIRQSQPFGSDAWKASLVREGHVGPPGPGRGRPRRRECPRIMTPDPNYSVTD